MKISIVIPAHNEEENVAPLCAKIVREMKKSKIVIGYEIIFVDDASCDSTLESIRNIDERHVVLLAQKSRIGKSLCIRNGITRAKYETIVTMDADMQNDPKDIEHLLAELEKGADFALGRRIGRNDGFCRNISSLISNFVGRIVLNHKMHDIGCGMTAFSKKCVEKIDFFEGIHRFLPLIVQKNGFDVREVEIRHMPRINGKSKYGFWNRIFKTTKDLFIVMKIIRGKKNAN